MSLAYVTDARERCQTIRRNDSESKRCRKELFDTFSERDVEPLGRTAEVQLLGDGDEVSQVAEFHVNTSGEEAE